MFSLAAWQNVILTHEVPAMASQHTNDAPQSYLPFNVPATPDKLQDVAARELGETTQVREKCLKQLRRLINDRKLPCVTTDDFLLRFLRVKKFDIKRSFEMLRNYAHQRVVHHRHLMKFEPHVIKTLLHHHVFGFLPYRDSEERLILVVQPGIWNPTMCPAEDLVLTLIVVTNYAFEQPSSQILGVVTLFENSHLSFRDIPYLVSHAKTQHAFLWNSLPLRYRKIHSINEGFLAKYMFQFFGPLIPKKIKDRVLLHGESRDVLFKHISPNILPTDFGGSNGPLSSDHLVPMMDDYLKKMKDEQRFFISLNS